VVKLRASAMNAPSPGEIEAWEYDCSCPLDDVVRLALQRIAEPSFRGRLLSRVGDALTVHVAAGAPSGAPESLYYVRGAGPFALHRLEHRASSRRGPAGGLLVTLRAVPGPVETP
jgi:hypothetical protein